MLPVQRFDISDRAGYREASPAGAAGDEILDRLWRPAQRFLGCRYGIVGGAMSWVSDHILVAAISEAGGFGVYAAAAMPADELRAGIEATRALTDRPFGVNIITFHPEFDRLVDLCIDCGVGHVVLGGGLPPAEAVDRLKRAGVRVLCFAATLATARRAVRVGADALILEGMEAGGHVGPVSTSVLAQEIIPHIGDVPVFVAGGIGRGEAVAAYLVMGAAGCQIGTRLACAKESPAHHKFKQAFIRARARDAMVSPELDSSFRVVPVRALGNPAMERFTAVQLELMIRVEQGGITVAEAQNEIEQFWAGRLRNAVVDGDVENGSGKTGNRVAE